MKHQYISGGDGAAVTERFFGDPVVSFLYSRVRENAGWLYRALISARLSRGLALLSFDLRPVDPARMRQHLAQAMGIDFDECLDRPEALDTRRKCFERRIVYWQCRPMDPVADRVLSPADARVLIGSINRRSMLYLKGKFFDLDDLLGTEKPGWIDRFQDADVAIFRLTPDRYHYTHVPVSGTVRDVYEIDGRYQSCHPAVVVAQATPYSRNRRTVTLIDTDVPGGTHVGMVAMIEVVALMIGDVHVCYSDRRYDNPRVVMSGMFLERGCPKSLFRPGSSTVVLLFEPGRIRFDQRLTVNRQNPGVMSMYSLGIGDPAVETDVRVRQPVGRALCRVALPGGCPDAKGESQ